MVSLALMITTVLGAPTIATVHTVVLIRIPLFCFITRYFSCYRRNAFQLHAIRNCYVLSHSQPRRGLTFQSDDTRQNLLRTHSPPEPCTLCNILKQSHIFHVFHIRGLFLPPESSSIHSSAIFYASFNQPHCGLMDFNWCRLYCTYCCRHNLLETFFFTRN